MKKHFFFWKIYFHNTSNLRNKRSIKILEIYFLLFIASTVMNWLRSPSELSSPADCFLFAPLNTPFFLYFSTFFLAFYFFLFFIIFNFLFFPIFFSSNSQNKANKFRRYVTAKVTHVLMTYYSTVGAVSNSPLNFRQRRAS